MNKNHLLPSARGVVSLILLAVLLLGCGQTSVQPSATYNPQEPISGGCGVLPMEEYSDVDYVITNGAL